VIIIEGQDILSVDDKYHFLCLETNKSFEAILYNVTKGHIAPRKKQKMRATMQKLYGVDFYSQCSDHNKKVEATNMQRYGVTHNMKHPQMALKNAISRNTVYEVSHWQTGEICHCVSTYEQAVVKYLNHNKKPFTWQKDIIQLSSSTYRPDLFLIDENKFIEIKGYQHSDFKEKWKEFIQLQLLM
jgi:hypothetical protein